MERPVVTLLFWMNGLNRANPVPVSSVIRLVMILPPPHSKRTASPVRPAMVRAPADHPKSPMPVDTSPDLCGRCHSDTRFGWQDWKVSTHYQRGHELHHVS